MVKKTIVFLLVLLTIMTLFAGCSMDTPQAASATASTSTASASTAPASASSASAATTSAASSKDLDIIWIHSGASNQSEQRSCAGFREYVKEQGWNWKTTEVNSEDSDAKAASNISDAVAKKCDVIICSAVDMRASAAAIKEASDAKIPIFTVDSGYTEGVVADVTCNNNVMSAKVSTYLTDVLGGKGNVCVLSSTGFAGGRKRGNVFNAVIKDCPGITVLDDHNINLADFYNDSANITEDWISRFGDKINAIWTVWDEPAMAAAKTLVAAGYTRDKVKIASIDGNEDAVQMMREGSPIIATVAQPFEVMGSTTAKLIQNYVVKSMPWDKAIGSTTIYVDAPLITTSNIPDKGTPAYKAVDFYNLF